MKNNDTLNNTDSTENINDTDNGGIPADIDESELEEMMAGGIMARTSFNAIIGSNNRSIEIFRLFLMLCACIFTLGLPSFRLSSYIQSACGFAPLAFFILSGFLVLGDKEKREERIVRAIKHSGIAFAAMLVFNVAVNVALFRFFDVGFMPLFRSKRLWFDFIVLNVWPFTVGDAIWYVQSLFYAYIAIWFLNKWKLLRFDRFIVIALLLFAVIDGELCGLIPLRINIYNFFPPNFFNRALPYLLLGGILADGIAFWTQLDPIMYVAGIVIGFGMVIAEPKFLNHFGFTGYYGHLIGMGVIAVFACLLLFWNVINREIDDCESSSLFDFFLSKKGTNLIYFVYQQTAMSFGFLIVRFIGSDFFNKISPYLGLITFVILFGFITAAVALYRIVIVKKAEKRNGEIIE